MSNVVRVQDANTLRLSDHPSSRLRHALRLCVPKIRLGARCSLPLELEGQILRWLVFFITLLGIHWVGNRVGTPRLEARCFWSVFQRANIDCTITDSRSINYGRCKRRLY